MHPVRLLQHILPLVLVELGGISRAGGAASVIQVARGFER